MHHLASVLSLKGAKSSKMACQMSAFNPHFLANNLCENELFTAEGQIMEREGSHNVKICTEIFTS